MPRRSKQRVKKGKNKTPPRVEWSIINVKNSKRGKLLKDITKIENVTQNMTSRYGTNPSYAFLRNTYVYSIPNSSENVNREADYTWIRTVGDL